MRPVDAGECLVLTQLQIWIRGHSRLTGKLFVLVGSA